MAGKTSLRDLLEVQGARRHTMSNAPTDDQAWQVLLEIPEQENEQAVVGVFARAVLAKWGTPQPVVREQKECTCSNRS